MCLKKITLIFYTLRVAKCNEIIFFVLSVKSKEEIDFPQTLLKAFTLYVNNFLSILQKNH